MIKKLLLTILILGFILLTTGLVISGGDLTKIANAFSNDSDYTFVEKIEKEEFNQIDIDIKSANLVINVYEELEYKIDFYESKYDIKSLKVEDKVLEIKQEYKNSLKWFNIKFTSKKIETINLYIPNTFNGKVEIESNSGNITINDFNFESLEINVASGNIKLDSGAVSTNIDLETNSGDISLNDLTTGILNAKSSSGNITVTNTKIDSNTYLNTSSGNIKFEDSESNELKGNASSGNINLTNNKINFIDLLVSSGNIRVNIKDLVEDYKIDANVNSGTIYFQGRNVGKKFINLSGSKSIKAKTSSGNIHITIEE